MELWMSLQASAKKPTVSRFTDTRRWTKFRVCAGRCDAISLLGILLWDQAPMGPSDST